MNTKIDQFQGFVDYFHFHDINDHRLELISAGFGTDPTTADHLPPRFSGNFVIVVENRRIFILNVISTGKYALID